MCLIEKSIFMSEILLGGIALSGDFYRRSTLGSCTRTTMVVPATKTLRCKDGWYNTEKLRSHTDRAMHDAHAYHPSFLGKRLRKLKKSEMATLRPPAPAFQGHQQRGNGLSQSARPHRTLPSPVITVRAMDPQTSCSGGMRRNVERCNRYRSGLAFTTAESALAPA